MSNAIENLRFSVIFNFFSEFMGAMIKEHGEYFRQNIFPNEQCTMFYNVIGTNSQPKVNQVVWEFPKNEPNQNYSSWSGCLTKTTDYESFPHLSYSIIHPVIYTKQSPRRLTSNITRKWPYQNEQNSKWLPWERSAFKKFPDRGFILDD